MYQVRFAGILLRTSSPWSTHLDAADFVVVGLEGGDGEGNQ